jgi:hypothetical protein
MNVCKHIVFGPPLCSSPVCPLAIYNPPFLFNLQLSPKVLITCRSLGHFLLFVAAVERKVLHHVEELHIAVTCLLLLNTFPPTDVVVLAWGCGEKRRRSSKLKRIFD